APPLHEVNPDVPAELERIVRKMLAKDPAKRYSTAADLAVDLEVLRRVSPLPRVLPKQAEAPHRKSRPLVILALGALMVAAAVAAATITYGPRGAVRQGTDQAFPS